MKNHKPQNVDSIDTSDISGSAEELLFYKLVNAKLLHIVYGSFAKQMFGSANSQIFKLRRDGGTFRLESYGIIPGRGTVEISDARISMTANSLTLSSNNGNVVIVELTGEKFNVNQFVKGAAEVIVPIFQLTILKNDTLVARYHLVELSM